MSKAISDIPKKTRIAAAWCLDGNFNQSRAADALDVSAEYVRQIKTDLERPEGERERISASELELAESYEIQKPIYDALREASAFRGLPDFDGGAESIEVPVEEIEAEVGRLEVLAESAEHGGDSEREYVARSAIEFLEGLLDDG